MIYGRVVLFQMTKRRVYEYEKVTEVLSSTNIKV